ncbi:hypothetical protein GIB67_039423 [Kingdonia uniflora]|uniref:Uncharacterized protein n=1 Tax=Kingdonia uniflora TaxID=39325 RepID=A0A7J7LIS9_9MAGN|nr:hypothetical protein GIB67_039423 [Kingdonia uniflora]
MSLVHVSDDEYTDESGAFGSTDEETLKINKETICKIQVEGAASEDGRTPSIWDTFAHAGNLPDKSNGDIACDHYHKYKEDVQLMAKTGLEAYRFSISWSRLIPNGRGAVNPKGLSYYNSLIDEFIIHGIQPHVTLFHYDTPQALEDEYGGWLGTKIVQDFTAYADVCFKEFGDRVLHWSTLNEPNVFALGGYDLGFFPPQRCSSPFAVNCTVGNSTVEPYNVAHNCLLAHASAARLYKQKYQKKQHGLIGLNIFAYWLVPLTNTTEDVTATQRATDFYIGWFINPLVFGDYPEIVKMNAGSRIPLFDLHESELVKGSYDFIGLNHYNTLYVKDDLDSLKTYQRDLLGDMAVKLTGLQTVPAFLMEHLGYKIKMRYSCLTGMELNWYSLFTLAKGGSSIGDNILLTKACTLYPTTNKSSWQPIKAREL